MRSCLPRQGAQSQWRGDPPGRLGHAPGRLAQANGTQRSAEDEGFERHPTDHLNRQIQKTLGSTPAENHTGPCGVTGGPFGWGDQWLQGWGGIGGGSVRRSIGADRMASPRLTGPLLACCVIEAPGARRPALSETGFASQPWEYRPALQQAARDTERSNTLPPPLQGTWGARLPKRPVATVDV